MSTEATYLLSPRSVNYEAASDDSVPPSKKRFYSNCLSAGELKQYMDDPVWIAFRIVILILLVITFTALLVLAVWICYNEYVYNCTVHPSAPRKAPAIIDTLIRNITGGNGG